MAREQLVGCRCEVASAVQNKGVADPAAAPFGDPLITLDSFGWSDGPATELASLTSEDVEDVLTSLTLLADGPVDITFEGRFAPRVRHHRRDKARRHAGGPADAGSVSVDPGPHGARREHQQPGAGRYLDTDARSTVDSHPVLSTILQRADLQAPVRRSRQLD